MELNDLWKEVRTNIPTKGEKKPKVEPPDGKALYMNPENWTRTKGIALVHKDTNTILGNFSEYIHRSIPHCRKLVREEAPISVSDIEEVEGSWWLGETRKPEPRQEWHEQRKAILHIYLEPLHLHAPICEVTVHLSHGGLARVELDLDTTFAQTEGEGQLMTLPAGTNILEVMSLDSKLSLRKEIGI